MHIQKSADLGWGICRQIGPDGLQLFMYLGNRCLQALHFGFHLLLRDQIMLHIQCSGTQQMGAADGDATRDGDTLQCE